MVIYASIHTSVCHASFFRDMMNKPQKCPFIYLLQLNTINYLGTHQWSISTIASKYRSVFSLQYSAQWDTSPLVRKHSRLRASRMNELVTPACTLFHDEGTCDPMNRCPSYQECVRVSLPDRFKVLHDHECTVHRVMHRYSVFGQ